ncbi:MAG: DUF2269 family protein [Gammaproteobacteria bacterium]
MFLVLFLDSDALAAYNARAECGAGWLQCSWLKTWRYGVNVLHKAINRFVVCLGFFRIYMFVTLKSLHVLGACLFIGNIIVSAYWKVLADRTRNFAVISFATRLVNLTDAIFTGLGVMLVLATGHMMADHYGGVLAYGWMLWSYVLFAISGLIWLCVLVPVQLKQARLLTSSNTKTISQEYRQLARVWAWAGTIATIAPLPAIYFMVSKGF